MTPGLFGWLESFDSGSKYPETKSKLKKIGSKHETLKPIPSSHTKKPTKLKIMS
jgi:hypothetical protein